MQSVSTDFTDFLKEYNVFGLAFSIIIAQTSIELSKNLTNDLIKPVVRSVINRTPLEVKVDEIISDFIMIVITLVVLFVLMKLFDVEKLVAKTAFAIQIPTV